MNSKIPFQGRNQNILIRSYVKTKIMLEAIIITNKYLNSMFSLPL